MEKLVTLNLFKVIQCVSELSGAEIRMLLGVLYCIDDTAKLFFNNIYNRSVLEEMGFGVSPERISGLLGSLVKKGVLEKKANGVYSIAWNLLA